MKMHHKTTNALMWRSLEGISVQGMQFVIQLILARLLIPEDFGVVAILNIFINLANTFVHSGLSNALLYKKDANQIDYCTVFYVEVGISILMYGILFVTAPYIALFYDNINLIHYLRVFALTIVFSSFGSIQTTSLRNNLEFKASFFANFIGICIMGIVGITLAIADFGVWSLIISQLGYRLSTSILLSLFAKWKPNLRFSIKSFKELFSYSWKLFVGWLIGTLYMDIFSLIIGKIYNETTLGYYSKGRSIPGTINQMVTQVTTAVMFPALAKEQDNNNKIKEQTRLMLSVSSALIFPIMAGIAAVAEPAVMIILTKKWLGAVPVIQILSISMAINVISNANMQSYNAVGRSDLFMYCEFVKRLITIILVCFLAKIGFIYMLWAIVSMGIISLLMNGYINIKLFGYSIKEQFCDIGTYMLYGVLLFILVNQVNFMDISYGAKLILQLVLCAMIYIISLLIIRRGAFNSIKVALLGLIKK